MNIQKRGPLQNLFGIMARIRRIARVGGACAVVFGASFCAAQPIDVFAAASMKPALDAIAGQYAEETGQVLRLSYAASSVLARQIDQGAPADVFVSASSDWMRYVDDAGLLSQPARVPLGIYAAQALSTLRLLQDLRPHLAQQDNARASLISVLRQESPLGLLYASDVRSAPGVFVVADIAPDSHDPVRYLAAAVTAGGEAVVAYLAGPKGRAVFSAYGFLAP